MDDDLLSEEQEGLLENAAEEMRALWGAWWDVAGRQSDSMPAIQALFESSRFSQLAQEHPGPLLERLLSADLHQRVTSTSSDIRCCQLFRAAMARAVQPRMKARPPTGVMAPSQRAPLSAIT